jgi:hypothetical protein
VNPATGSILTLANMPVSQQSTIPVISLGLRQRLQLYNSAGSGQNTTITSSPQKTASTVDVKEQDTVTPKRVLPTFK